MKTRPGAAAVEVPCTCGELVQGVSGEEPFLVSCPIDRYSRVGVALGRPSSDAGASGASARILGALPAPDLESGSGLPPWHRDPDAADTQGGCKPLHSAFGIPAGPGFDPPTKAIKAAELTLEFLGHGGLPFTLEVACPLPPSKGFGTSTADVVGAIVATATAAGASLSAREVARLAVSVEPSDGTMFPGLALFNHRSARSWEGLGEAPPLVLVVLEFAGTVDTLEYNAALDLERLRFLEPRHARALDLLREGLRRGRLDLVGEAATLSAETNQQVLPKPQLEPVIDLARRHRALGVCAAHSGTALGVLFPREMVGEAQTLRSKLCPGWQGLDRAWISALVGGGPRVVPAVDPSPRPLLLPTPSPILQQGVKFT